MQFNDHLIPYGKGNAVGKGWTKFCPQPSSVTWHWTATWDLKTCRKVLGGENPLRKGSASAHFGVGRTREEGVDRYVRIRDRSWHCGANQTLRWDGKPCRYEGVRYSGARCSIGIEMVNIGYARRKVKAGDDWIKVAPENGKDDLLIQPWTEEQIQMCIELGKYIVDAYPNITWRDHHGHSDVCPGYKLDPIGFPFARVLREIYENPNIPDIWKPFSTIEARQETLLSKGYDLGRWGADGDWGRVSDAALRQFQKDNGLVVNGMWTKFVSEAMLFGS